MTDAVVRAPISGTVSKRHVQPGEKVSFDAPLLSIVDLAQLEVQAQVPISDVTQIRKGMPTHVDVEGIDGRKFEGSRRAHQPKRRAGHAHDQHLRIAFERGLVVEGRHVRACVADRSRPKSKCPRCRCRRCVPKPRKTFVWIVADEKLARRNIVVGKRDERAQLVEVTSGLAPGDVVLASKFDNLKEGLAAKVISQAAESSVADRERRAPARN